jgi:hypothetical protein
MDHFNQPVPGMRREWSVLHLGFGIASVPLSFLLCIDRSMAMPSIGITQRAIKIGKALTA